jgi:hypothetical protein
LTYYPSGFFRKKEVKVLNSSSIVSLILSSAVGIVCAGGYLILLKRSVVRAIRNPGPFELVQTLSGLFLRLVLTVLVLLFISKISLMTSSINFFVVVINFIVMVSVLFLWIARGFSKEVIITE